MIGPPGGARIWLAADVTDMRKGFDGLAALVQQALTEDPFSGQVFVFRGRRGDLIKLLWWVCYERLAGPADKAVLKMREGPSESPVRGRLQSTNCCCAKEAWW